MKRCTRLHADELLGCADAAEYSGLSRTVFGKYRSLGLVPKPAIRIGGAPAWTRAQLDEWLETRKWRSEEDRDRILGRRKAKIA